MIPVTLRLAPALTFCFVTLFTGSLNSQNPAGFDPLVYQNSATAEIVELARARHQVQSLRLAGYRSKVFTRLEGHVGASRYGRGWTVFKYETAARMHWTRNGDLKVDIEGGRMTGTRMPGFGRGQMASFFEDIFGGEVWFVPSTAGDDLELMGLPEAEAVHPLARGAQRYYRYEIEDSMRVAHPERSVRVISVRVEPRVEDAVAGMVWSQSGDQVIGWDERSLIAGRLWIDADSLDVVRLTGAFVGDYIWDDDDDAPQLVNLEADIEYSLHQNWFWLPHRQVLTAHWIFKYLPGADLVGMGITTFSDHEVDLSHSEIAFTHQDSSFPAPEEINRYVDGRVTEYRVGRWRCPDAWEFDNRSSTADCGGSSATKVGSEPDGAVWEVNMPTLDSLTSYEFGSEWEETVDLAGREFLDNAVREIASLGTSSAAVHPFARDDGGLDWKHIYNAVGFNRVQGFSLGGGYQIGLWPPYTTLHLNARYGFSDKHLLGSIAWRRDAPSGRFEVSAYRSVDQVDPWEDQAAIGSSLRALVLGHDDADYYLASVGFGVVFRGYTGLLENADVALHAERQGTLDRTSSSFIAGAFQQNPPIADGDYMIGTASKSWYLGFSGTTSLTVGTQAMVSEDSLAGRIWGDVFLPYESSRTLLSLRLRGGYVTGHLLPQMSYRVGGSKTVRGYQYGIDAGRSFWSAQWDLEWVVSPWWSPILFADAGSVGFSDTPLISAGVGLSLLSGWARIEFAKGMTVGGGFHLDMKAGIPLN